MSEEEKKVEEKPAFVNLASKEWPEWLNIANAENGVHEISGEEDNERIVEYHSTTTLKADDDETPWCSAFVNWCMKQAGIEGTNLANARSWLTWGKKLERPQVGCVVIMKRGDNPKSGHVGLLVEEHEHFIIVLGGNQSDCVKLSTFPKETVIGYRWPETKQGGKA